MERRPDSDDGSQGGALRRAKALAAPARRTILSLLDDGRPQTAQELAVPLGVHHTAVRQHMTVLEDAGLVTIVRLPPEGRGRPRVAYRSVGDIDPYRRLAGMLADAVAGGLSPREAGQRHGEAACAGRDGDDPFEALLEATERLGFQPRVRDSRGKWELVLQSCPFAHVAAAAPEVVCELHLGIAEGIAHHLGGLEILDLRVADPHVAGCRLVTRRLT